MHIPVLKEQVVKYLDPKPNENFIDCTFGLGGHTKAILEKNAPQGKVLGIETDSELFQQTISRKQEFSDRLLLVNESYVNLKEIAKQNNFKPVHGILLDLGLSSWHIKHSGRGFSFQRDEPLNMLFSVRLKSDTSLTLTAEKIVNFYKQGQIERILKDYGEEKFARQIAQKIVEARRENPLKTTFQLVEIIKQAIPKKFHRPRHPAVKTFQALRIAVNSELENLKIVLPQAMDILCSEGRLAIISFHSLEDRIVKNFFKEQEKSGKGKILTKKPIVPNQKEVILNPCSRSAKLRAIYVSKTFI